MMTVKKGSYVAEDYKKVLNVLIKMGGLSREDIVEKTGLNLARVNQMLRLLDNNKRLIRNGRWLKDSKKFWVTKRK